MVDQKLIKYLKESLAKGYSIDKLTKALIKEGWDPSKVEEAAKQFRGAQNASIKQSSTPVKKAEEEGKDPDKKEKSKKDLGEKNQKSEKKRPVGVIIVAILHWIITASIVISAAMQLFFQADVLPSSLFSFIQGSMMVILMSVAVVLALLPFFAGLGIWKGKNAWRIVAIIFGIIGTIGGLFSLMQISIQGVISLVISGYIAFYLLLAKGARQYFKDD